MQTVWVIGSINVDTTYNMARLPHEGETLSATGSFSALGGKGANQAVAAKATGAHVCLAGCVGADAAGNAAREKLAKRGVELTHLCSHPTDPTGSAIILVEQSGKNLIVVNGGANLAYAYTALPFSAGDYVMAQLETPIEAVEAAFAAAKAEGCTTVLNPSPCRELPDALLRSTDILIVNEHEIETVSGVRGKDGIAAMQRLAEMGIAKIVLTLGGEGALLFHAGALTPIAGIRVDACVDTQGAGDAFAGILIGEMSKDVPFVDAAERANTVAAKCVTVSGSTIKSLEQIGL